MTATKGKAQGRQVELQLLKNPNAASTFAMSKEETELVYLELFPIPEERGNSQGWSIPKGEHRQHCPPSVRHLSNIFTSWNKNSEE